MRVLPALLSMALLLYTPYGTVAQEHQKEEQRSSGRTQFLDPSKINELHISESLAPAEIVVVGSALDPIIEDGCAFYLLPIAVSEVVARRKSTVLEFAVEDDRTDIYVVVSKQVGENSPLIVPKGGRFLLILEKQSLDSDTRSQFGIGDAPVFVPRGRDAAIWLDPELETVHSRLLTKVYGMDSIGAITQSVRRLAEAEFSSDDTERTKKYRFLLQRGNKLEKAMAKKALSAEDGVRPD